MTGLVESTLLLVQIDEAGIEVMFSTTAKGWIWFNREDLRKALRRPEIHRSHFVNGPYNSALEAGQCALQAKGLKEEQVAA